MTSLFVEMNKTEKSGFFRLRVSGGKYDGLRTEVISAPLHTANNTLTASVSSSGFDSAEHAGDVAKVVLPGAFILGINSDETHDVAVPYSYQWYRIDRNDYSQRTKLEGQTSKEYTVSSSDVGYVIQVEIKAGTAYRLMNMGLVSPGRHRR